MIKHNRSKFEVRSSCKGYGMPPHAWSEDPRGGGPSIPTDNYRYSKPNHTFINNNYYTYNLNHHTINDAINYPSISDNCTSINAHDHSKKLEHCNGNYTYGNENIDYANGKYTSANGNCTSSNGNCTWSTDDYRCNTSSNACISIDDNCIDEGEDGFAFSSFSGSMDFFNFNSNEAQALLLHAPLSMAPADELFEDGKIRPLMQPIGAWAIIHSYDQPNRSKPAVINDHDQPNYSKPVIINGHNQLNFLNSRDQKPVFNGYDQLNRSKLVLNHSNTAAQSISSTSDSIIKQESAETIISESTNSVIKQDSDAQTIISANGSAIDQELDAKKADKAHSLMQKGDPDDVLSSEINQRVKEMCNWQLVNSEVDYGESAIGLSASSSPAKEFLATNDHINEKQYGINQAYSVISTSQVNCYRRCGSLSKIFQFEDNEQIMEVQDLIEDGTIMKGGLTKRRTTLQDFLIQEELGLGIPNKDVINSYDALMKRPSLAPTPTINIPQLWPIRGKLLVAPPTTTGNNKVGAPSPHGVHYAFQKARAERMKKKTFLPYRPGLLGCLGYPPQ